jgi:crotonobetainyl-CoA:carnitine CoA-transferase CaiB-like acyl-CoA transferase
VALSVRDAADWDALVQLLGEPAWARDPDLASTSERRRRADELDEELRAWSAQRSADELAGQLRERGIPAAKLLVATEMYGEPQLEARGFYQTLDHPVTGKRRYPVWPLRFSFADAGMHPSGAPTLGQHNNEVLGGELGLSTDDLARLRREGVIGERWSLYDDREGGA